MGNAKVTVSFRGSQPQIAPLTFEVPIVESKTLK
jgi:hypothetical protein